MARIVYQSISSKVSIEISKDKRSVEVFYSRSEQRDKIADFMLVDVWDMICNTMATVDANPNLEPGLFRRKGEAAASIAFTVNLLGD